MSISSVVVVVVSITVVVVDVKSLSRTSGPDVVVVVLV